MDRFNEGDIIVPIKQPTTLKVKINKLGDTLFRGEVVNEGKYGNHTYRNGETDLWTLDRFDLEINNALRKFNKGDIIRCTKFKDAECLLIINFWTKKTEFSATVLYADSDRLEVGDILENCDQNAYELANIDLVFKLKGNGNS